MFVSIFYISWVDGQQVFVIQLPAMHITTTTIIVKIMLQLVCYGKAG